MDNEQKLPVRFAERAELILPEFGSRPAQCLDISKVKEGEKRLVEAKVVTSGTYNELSYTFNEAWREARQQLSVIGYEITRTKKDFMNAKSEALLDKYPDFLNERKLKDSKCFRDAFLQTQEEYVKAQDRIDMLVALEHLLEGKIKVFENVCKYMDKQMNLDIKSGYMDFNKYTH
ncbi:MAG: hypothetical protein PHF86_10390 [Candidatus Nanoarchaeia archaeon]|jgi:hypothetical protein|nr:hypothetical protein [Candidatus Nanoarchaeia archaeon]